jgi:Zn-dependent peptidase ImmA (M78 family)/transcriptional regulator with XRE-family HTH domain
MKPLTEKEIAKNIRNLRKKLDLNQKELARKAGLSSDQIIEKFEKGRRSLKANELYLIAKALDVDVNDVVSLSTKPKRVKVFWRSPPDNAREVEAKFLKRCQSYRRLEELCSTSEPKVLPTFPGKLSKMTYRDAAEYATDIRRMMELGSKPALALTKILEEDYAVKIFFEKMVEGSAASTVSDFGLGILMNNDEAPWRRNYNFAHELFHLVTWPETYEEMDDLSIEERDKIEKLANAFASSLLMPEDSLLEEINRFMKEKTKASYLDLIELARSFDVSTEALLWRFVNLRKLSREKVKELLQDDSFRDLDRQSMMGLWFNAPHFPVRYVRLAYRAYLNGNVSRMKLAEYLDCSLLDLDDALKDYGIIDSESFETEVTIA